MIRVLVLDSDPWRYRGICGVLRDTGTIAVAGEIDFAKILTLSEPAPDLDISVIVLSERLIVEYGVSVVPHLKDLFSDASILVYGEHDSLESTAQLLAVGASGFFPLSGAPGYLMNAVRTIAKGKLWGPREAVALFARRATTLQIRREDRSGPQVRTEDMKLIELLSAGQSNRAIAKELGIAESTVKARLSKLFKLFGVATRLQLLTIAIDQGLITPATRRDATTSPAEVDQVRVTA